MLRLVRGWEWMLCFALLPASAQADLYSWTDADGVIHLTNVRPESRKQYETLREEGFGGALPLVKVHRTGKKRVYYPVNVRRFDPLFRAAARKHGLPFALVKAVAKVESNFNPKAVSRADAKGLMQLIDSTAAQMDVDDPFDPKQAINGGARYLRLMSDTFDGDMALAVAAYNAGPHRVKRAGGIPNIRETQRYVRRVLSMYRVYLKLENEAGT